MASSAASSAAARYRSSATAWRSRPSSWPRHEAPACNAAAAAKSPSSAARATRMSRRTASSMSGSSISVSDSSESWRARGSRSPAARATRASCSVVMDCNCSAERISHGNGAADRLLSTSCVSTSGLAAGCTSILTLPRWRKYAGVVFATFQTASSTYTSPPRATAMPSASSMVHSHNRGSAAAPPHQRWSVAAGGPAPIGAAEASAPWVQRRRSTNTAPPRQSAPRASVFSMMTWETSAHASRRQASRSRW
mmetsp:Transcript_48219/g.111644  ORF Transcript_48219/g.111644 Transcript_48219/m.111644 type:complete len:252 (+) Transcript_48219:309-1064(+)